MFIETYLRIKFATIQQLYITIYNQIHKTLKRGVMTRKYFRQIEAQTLKKSKAYD